MTNRLFEELLEDGFALSIGFFLAGSPLEPLVPLWGKAVGRFGEGLFDLRQATFAQKTKRRPLGAQDKEVIGFQRMRLQTDGVPVHLHEASAGEILHPVLALGVKDLGVHVEQPRVVE